MEKELSIKDLNFILESLNYTRLNFEETKYPSSEFKRQRLGELEGVMSKVQNLLKELKK